MRDIPFRRIAILDPFIIFQESISPKWTEGQAEILNAWEQRALLNRADAAYMRLQNTQELVDFNSGLVEAMNQSSLQIILRRDTWQAGLPAAAIHFTSRDERRPEKGFLCGKSCHDEKSVISAQKRGFDYVYLSPVFSTRTHPDAPALGIHRFREICAKVEIPVIALGGIHPGNEAECLDSGAHGIAGISLFLS